MWPDLSPSTMPWLAFGIEEAERCRALWVNKDMADVVVVFTTDPEAVTKLLKQHGMGTAAEAASSSARSDAKRVRTEPQPQILWPESCVALPAHEAQLFKASEYFKTQASGLAELHQRHVLPRQLPSGRRVDQVVTMVKVESQAELAAAEPLVRLMYHFDVCSELRDDPFALLQLCLLADRLQARACSDACATALASLPPADLPLIFTNHLRCVARTHAGDSMPQLKALAVDCSRHAACLLGQARVWQQQPPPPLSRQLLHQLTPLAGLSSEELDLWLAMCILDRLLADRTQLPQLRTKCSSRVLRQIFDADRLASGAGMDMFCALTEIVVHHWLASDQLRVSSENTVVWLLHKWRAAMHDHWTKAADRQLLDSYMETQLAPHVRLRHLSPAYLQGVLPTLPWFGPKATLAALAPVLSSTPPDLVLDLPGQVQVPQAWLAAAPRPKPATRRLLLSTPGAQAAARKMLVTVSVAAADVEAALAEVLAAAQGQDTQRSWQGPWLLVNGFQFALKLTLQKAEGGAQLGLELAYGGLHEQWPQVPWVHVEWSFSCGPASEQSSASQPQQLSKHVFAGRQAHGCTDVLKLGAISTMEPLAPYLEGGELRAAAHITCVDGMKFV